jgi:hypothetical protein
MTPEGKLKAKLVKWATERGIQSIRFAFRPGVTVGWPDTMFLVPGGRGLFIELKAPGKRPTPIQHHRLETLRELGYAAIWTDNADTARAAITHAMGAGRPAAAGSRAP